MYDHELTLIQREYTEDEIGNQIPVETETTILCGKKSVSRSEFYSAAVKDFKPEIIFVIHPYEYDEQKEVEFDGQRYKVIRTYSASFEELELTAERL